jgi:dGTPase
VTRLERKYAAFDGLNLTFETLEGLAKHNGPLTGEGHAAVAKVARTLEAWRSLEPARWASAEAQVASLSDDIAYLNHDVDDGLRAGLIALPDLRDVPVAGEAVAAARAKSAERVDGRVIFEVGRRMITAMIRDLVDESRARLTRLVPESPEDIRGASGPTIGFSGKGAADLAQLKAFLFERVYRSPRVTRVMAGAEVIVGDLFRRYHADQSAMPEAWAAAGRMLEERRRARIISDFVAGMTDRYAEAEHRRLFQVTPELR